MRNNKISKNLSFVAICGLAIGVTSIVSGVTVGVLSIINSSKIMKIKNDL